MGAEHWEITTVSREYTRGIPYKSSGWDSICFSFLLSFPFPPPIRANPLPLGGRNRWSVWLECLISLLAGRRGEVTGEKGHEGRMGEEKEYIIVERGLPGFQPRRDYRAKLKSRNGDVCEPAVPRRLAPFLSSPLSLGLLFVGGHESLWKSRSISAFPGPCLLEHRAAVSRDTFPRGIKRFRVVVGTVNTKNFYLSLVLVISSVEL